MSELTLSISAVFQQKVILMFSIILRTFTVLILALLSFKEIDASRNMNMCSNMIIFSHLFNYLKYIYEYIQP